MPLGDHSDIWEAIDKDREKIGDVEQRLAAGAQTFQAIHGTLERLEKFMEKESERRQVQDKLIVQQTERLTQLKADMEKGDDQLRSEIDGVGGKIKNHLEEHKANRKWWAAYLLGTPAAVAGLFAAVEKIKLWLTKN
jgi:chromosome segregation ATPase